jgi:hypothetical protein
MFELSGSQFEKGVLELRLEKSPAKILAWYLKLGPIKARLIAFAGLGFAFMLGINRAPSKFFMESGWAASSLEASQMQDKVMWFVAAVSIFFYALVFMFRMEKLEISFDRSAQALEYFHIRPLFFQQPRQGRIPFTLIQKLKVFAKDRAPHTPFGFIEITTKDLPKPYNSLSFKVLTPEQLKFFPLNIGRIVDKEPEGDWVDPQDQPKPSELS